MTMYLDRIKAKKLLKEHLEKDRPIKSAALALAGDESWNHEIIYSDGKFRNNKDWKCYFSSYWATPILIIYYEDDSERRLDCYFTEDDEPKRAKEAERKHGIARKQLLKYLKTMVQKTEKKRKSITK